MSSNLIGLDLDHVPGVLHLGDLDHHLPDHRGQGHQEWGLCSHPGPHRHPHYGGGQPEPADSSPTSISATRYRYSHLTWYRYRLNLVDTEVVNKPGRYRGGH